MRTTSKSQAQQIAEGIARCFPYFRQQALDDMRSDQGLLLDDDFVAWYRNEDRTIVVWDSVADPEMNAPAEVVR